MRGTVDKRVAEQMQLAEDFSDENPNPVLKVSLEGDLLYVNKASRPLLAAWGIHKKGRLPGDLATMVTAALSSGLANCAEISCGDRSFALELVPNAPKRCVTIYGLDVTERKRTEKALRESEHFNKEIISGANQGIIVYDSQLRYIVWNHFMEKLTGMPLEKMLGKKPFEVFPDLQRYGVEELHEKALTGEVADGPDMFLRIPPENKVVCVSSRYSPFRNADGEIAGVICIVIDITERKKAEEEMMKLCAFQRAITRVNETLLWARDETELFQRICDIVVTVPNVIFAWIGSVEKRNFEVEPIVFAGYEDGYLSTAKVRWDNSPNANCPTATAIKSGRIAVSNDLENDPGFKPFCAEALKRGYAALLAVPLVHGGAPIGVLNLYSSIPNSLGDEEIRFLIEVAGDVAVGVRSLRLEKNAQASLDRLQKLQDETVEAVGGLCEVRDPFTAGHDRRVAKLSCAIADEMGLSDYITQGLFTAGMLHDIGKIAVPTEILCKPGKVSVFELGIIKSHPRIGYDILKRIQFPWPVADAVLQHHERIDGSGYDQGLSGDEIILEAKILAVADVVEAMASHRPYRPALGIDKALEEISEKKGILYDVDVANACINCFTKRDFKLE